MQLDLAVMAMPTASLVPYAANARTHSEAQVAQIAASIAEFGFVNPVLVDAAGVLVAGHGRVLAAKRLGLATVPDAQVNAFMAGLAHHPAAQPHHRTGQRSGRAEPMEPVGRHAARRQRHARRGEQQSLTDEQRSQPFKVHVMGSPRGARQRKG